MKLLNHPYRSSSIVIWIAIWITFRAAVLFTLFFLIKAVLLIETASAEIPLTVEESLVSFSPAIRLKSGSECLGARIAERVIVTSPLCAQAILSQAGNTTAQVVDTEGSPVGNIIPVNGSQAITPLDKEMLLDLSNAIGNEFEYYPHLRSSDTPPDTAYAYFKGVNGSIVQEPVVVTELKVTKEQRYFDVDSTSKALLPSSAMVLDDQNNLVCQMSNKRQCLSVPLQQTVRTRELSQYDEGGDFVSQYFLPIVLPVTVIAVVGTGVISSFYVVTYIRANRLRIPAAIFFKGMCSCAYCQGWSALSTYQCCLGVICFPFTCGYSAACFYAAPLTAAWNYLDGVARQLTLPEQQVFLPESEQLPSLPPPSAVVIQQ
ncbi:MAG: hypothetical protein ACR2PT_22465 [Endozoicomonas sp.]